MLSLSTTRAVAGARREQAAQSVGAVPASIASVNACAPARGLVAGVPASRRAQKASISAAGR